MGEHQKPSSTANPPTNSPPPPGASGGEAPPWKRYPNPPDPFIPDQETLRDQWRYASRKFSRFYSQAWGGAILAGAALFGLGWIIKGSNPLPSRALGHGTDHPPPPPSDAGTDRTNQ